MTTGLVEQQYREFGGFAKDFVQVRRKTYSGGGKPQESALAR